MGAELAGILRKTFRLDRQMEKMKFKGTKGKWKIVGEPFISNDLPEGTGPHSGSWNVTSGETTIVNVPAYSFWGLTYQEAKANAQLISKAPEVLEMLEKVLNNSDVRSEIYDQATQLIKEATTIE